MINKYLAIATTVLILGTAQVAQSKEIFSTHNDGRRLGTIDQVTGAGTDVGSFGTSATWAAAWDPDGILYTIFNGFSGAGATLAEVDELSGGITPVGSVGRNMISLEVACDGTMYGVGYSDRILYRIDKTTGAATVIGNTAIINNMDLAIDSNDTLWATVGNRLWTLNTTTGASTLVGAIAGIASGAVMGIMFDDQDNMYATAYVSNSPLYLVDTNTLVATQVGNTGFFLPHGGDFRPDCVIHADIDIKPWSDPNSVNYKSKGVIPVAILTTGSFDATNVDPQTVEFGPNGAPIAHEDGHVEDVDADGYLDLVLHFRTQQTGIQCGDTQATLTGETYDGKSIEGVDLVNTVACKNYH